MGAFSELFRTKPKQLSQGQFAQFDAGVHALLKRPKNPNEADPNFELRRSSQGVHVGKEKANSKHRSDQMKARLLLIKHLKNKTNQAHYGEANAEKAIQALNSLEPGFKLEALRAALAPVSTAEQRAQTKLASEQVVSSARQLASKSLEQLGEGVLPDAQAGVDAGDAAYAGAHDWGLAFHEQCCVKPARTRVNADGKRVLVEGDTKALRKAKEALRESFAKTFGNHALTCDLKLTPDTLSDEMLIKPAKQIEALTVQLEDLLSMAKYPGADGKAVHDEKILAVTEKLMRCIERSAQVLAAVGSCLNNELAGQSPAQMRVSMENFGSHLVNLSRAYLDPNGSIMDTYRWAKERHDIALNRRACDKLMVAANTVQAIARDLRSTSQDPLRKGSPVKATSPSAQENARQAYEATSKMAHGAFEAVEDLVAPAQGSAAAVVRERLNAALMDHPLTWQLGEEDADLFEALFQAFPSSVGEQRVELDRLVRLAQTEAGMHNAALHTQIAEKSQELMALVARYMEVLATVGHVLANEVARDDLPMATQKALLGFAISLVGLAQTMADPAGPFMLFFGNVQAQERKASQKLDELRNGRDATHDMRQAVTVAEHHWKEFYQLCLHPKDGLSGLSAEQRRARQAWAAQWPRGYGPGMVPPQGMADLLIKEWPEKIEAARAQLDKLVNARGPEVDKALEDKILVASLQLTVQIDDYFAQLDATAGYLAQAFPTEGMPPSFQLAAKQAGKSLQALSALQREPARGTAAGAHGLAQQARADAHERLEQWEAAHALEATRGADKRSEQDRALDELLKTDALPSPRGGPRRFADLDDKQIGELSNEDWLDFVLEDSRQQLKQSRKAKELSDAVPASMIGRFDGSHEARRLDELVSTMSLQGESAPVNASPSAPVTTTRGLLEKSTLTQQARQAPQGGIRRRQDGRAALQSNAQASGAQPAVARVHQAQGRSERLRRQPHDVAEASYAFAQAPRELEPLAPEIQAQFDAIMGKDVAVAKPLSPQDRAEFDAIMGNGPVAAQLSQPARRTATKRADWTLGEARAPQGSPVPAVETPKVQEVPKREVIEPQPQPINKPLVPQGIDRFLDDDIAAAVEGVRARERQAAFETKKRSEIYQTNRPKK